MSKQLKALNAAIEKQLAQSGLEMRKLLNSGGMFSDATYDRRTVYNLEDLYKLNDEGFKLHADVGVFLFNAIIRYEDE